MQALILAGNAETNPRASLIVGAVFVALVLLGLYVGYRKLTKRR